MRWIAIVSAAAVLLLTACQSAAPTPVPPTAPPAAAPTTAPTPPAKPTAAAAAPTVAATAAATAVPAAAPTVAPTAPPQAKLVIDVEADLESLDPYLSYSPTGLSIHHNLFDYLLERDVRGDLAPGIAESWKATGPTTLEFKLRRGVKFHNGQDVTSSAVKYSAERMLDEKLNSGVRSRFTSIKSVNVVDPYTVQFELAKADPSLLDSLTNQMAILPESFDPAKPVGSGPYRFAEWVRGDHITLDANAGYWSGSAKGRPIATTVVFRPVTSAGTRLADLQSGQAHIVAGLSPTQAKTLEKAGAGPSVQVADLPGYQYVFFNTKVDDATPLKDARVRQALNLAIDRRAIVENLIGNYVKPLKEPVGPLTAGYDPALPDLAYDPARAKQLLAEAGVGSGFALTLDVSQADRDDVVDAVAAQLGQVGVNVTIQTLDLSAFNDRWIAHKMDGLFFVRWNNFSDPGTLNLLASCSGFLSFSCSPAADEFFAQGEATLDDAVRVKAYQQAMGALADDPFAIYLTTRSALYGVSDRVSGWKPSASGYLYATDAQLR